MSDDARFAGLTAILLAAGRGTRFAGDGGGPGGKLAADLAGRPVAHHAAAMLAGLPFARRIAVVAPGGPGFAAFGFAEVVPDPPGAPLSASLAAGVSAAGGGDVLIALADMPLVPAAHIRALVRAFAGDRVASLADGRPMPPAVFAAHHAAALGRLSGDRGAGALLRGAPAVALPPGAALDVDRPADLAAAARWRAAG